MEKKHVGGLGEGWHERGGKSVCGDLCLRAQRRAWEVLRDARGQGTTEYAILVGVLVVIAILAIIAFRGKVQQLWDAIVSGMNAL